MHILIVEDNALVASGIQAGLELHGFTSDTAGSVAQAQAHMASRQFDACVLDLGLPDGDGVSLLLDLRSWSKVPVIVLSARVDEVDKIAALDAGADDYLTKPFGVGELLARVRALQRRRSGDGSESNGSLVRLGEAVTVDMANRSVSRDGEPVHLTQLEYRLLATLLAHRGKVLTHRQLLQEVWGPGYVEHSHYLRIYMAHLRQKLEADPAQPRFLRTETGVGYRLL